MRKSLEPYETKVPSLVREAWHGKPKRRGWEGVKTVLYALFVAVVLYVAGKGIWWP
jgi:hypothetical protein